MSLTPWKPGYNIFIVRNRPKTSSSRLPYQRHSSCADCCSRAQTDRPVI